MKIILEFFTFSCRISTTYNIKNPTMPYRFIVEKGGLLTASDKHGWSVLQYAVRYASLETVETLIELGADIFHRS